MSYDIFKLRTFKISGVDGGVSNLSTPGIWGFRKEDRKRDRQTISGEFKLEFFCLSRDELGIIIFELKPS